jgi:peroxiredoxin
VGSERNPKIIDMNKVLFLLLLTVLISKGSFAQKGKFEIRGKLSGFADSTIIYLDNLTTSSPVHIDSTLVINNQFYFSGSIKEVMRVMLRTIDFTDYKYFWLENTAIEFNAEKGKFRGAIITGSETQNEQSRLDSAIKTNGKEKEQSISFIRNHPNSIISADILSTYASTWGKDTSAILYRNLSEEIKTTYYGKNIEEFIALNKNIKVGDRYVDFTEPNIEGKNISLSDFQGKVVLLEFWGSWCGPCRQGNPELVKIYNEFKNTGFDILGVAADEKREAWIEAIQKDSLTWQNVTDLRGDKNRAALIYGVSYYPANFLVDRNGIIIATDLRGDDLRNKLRELLK